MDIFFLLGIMIGGVASFLLMGFLGLVQMKREVEVEFNFKNAPRLITSTANLGELPDSSLFNEIIDLKISSHQKKMNSLNKSTAITDASRISLHFFRWQIKEFKNNEVHMRRDLQGLLSAISYFQEKDMLPQLIALAYDLEKRFNKNKKNDAVMMALLTFHLLIHFFNNYNKQSVMSYLNSKYLTKMNLANERAA